MITKNKRLISILLTVPLLLLIGVLLLGTGLMCELVLRKVKKIKYRIAICGAILVVLLLIWMELAVGIFGTPFAGS
jgi:hypothetical protein